VILGTNYFINYELKKEFNFDLLSNDINGWQEPILNQKYEFEFLKKKIKYQTPIRGKFSSIELS
jgi:hypothetical protein